MADQEPPKLSYPCEYPIKVVGRQAADFVDLVVQVMKSRAPEISADSVAVKSSSGGKFISVTVTFIATGEQQIMAIYEDLKATGRVMTVL
jgi:putative lipoic acid-binding regulatory protein